jgi:hypothetical protein
MRYYETRTSYVQRGQAVEYVESAYRADRYKAPNNLVPLKPKFVVQDAKSR